MKSQCVWRREKDLYVINLELLEYFLYICPYYAISTFIFNIVLKMNFQHITNLLTKGIKYDNCCKKNLLYANK